MTSLVTTAAREAIFSALFTRVWAATFTALPNGATTWRNDQTLARRLRLWAEVPADQRPALYQFEGLTEDYTYMQQPMPKRKLEAALYIYTDCKDPTVIGTQLLNTLISAIETALAPDFTDARGGGGMRNTLGGLVHSCRIEGRVFRDPGDLDGDGMARIPVVILVP